MKQEFLITIQTDERTRVCQEPEHFRSELQAYAQKLFTVHTQGSVPAVTVAIVDQKLLGERLQALLEAGDEEDERRAKEQGEPFWKE